MSLLPIFLKLDGRRCLLVGAGKVALGKIGALLPTGLQLNVVAPEACDEIQKLASEGQLQWIARAFEPHDLDGNFLVIAATNSTEINATVYRGATERNILCNSVDDIPHCDFFFGSVVSRGPLQIAISTSGESPAFAQHLRQEIDEQLPSDLGPWLTAIGQRRREILATHPAGESRRLLLHRLAKPAPHESLSSEPDAKSGNVYLVGAGPGNPDLLTVRATRLLQSADLILHDDLVPPEILSHVAPYAEVVNVGKRCGVKLITQDAINTRMIEQARTGRSIVRLKSGDPLLFGRASEEIAALMDAAIPFEIIPGITAAFAAAAAAGFSLTSRTGASSVTFSAGHHAPTRSLHAEETTRIVYMPGRDLSSIAQEWLAQGFPDDTPCAMISRASQPDQHVRCTTLGQLGNAVPDAAPSLLILGRAVSESKYMANMPADCIPATT